MAIVDNAHTANNISENDELTSHLTNVEHSTTIVNHMYQSIFKPVLGLVLSVVALIILAIPMLTIAAIVALNSPGPILFRQTRGGKNGHPFTVWKFRTMYVSAPEKANKDFSHDAMAHYMTPVGKVLRKYSLDELPQIFNVLAGQMSFIGPRPLAKTDAYALQLRKQVGADQVRPGITGLAQVNGRNGLNDDQKVAYDKEYCDRCSLKMDLGIILKSVIVVLGHHGINKVEE